MKRKVAAYYRFSSNGQNVNSIAYQRQATQNYCNRVGFELVKEYVDEAQSGANDNRVSFRQMIKDAEKYPEWDMILVYDYSRFARNLVDAMKACQNHTIELTEENIVSVCNRFAKHLISSEDVEVRQFLKATINEILVSRDDVQISLNIA